MIMGFLDRLRAPKASISVLLDKQFISFREPMTGKIVVSSNDDFETDDIRIEMWVTEWVQATEKKTSGQQTFNVTAQQNSNLHQSRISVAGYTKINPGFNKEYPFNFHLPQGVPPTYQSQNVRTTWMIKGVIGIKGRPDVTSNNIEIRVTY
jgi:hypothetical protein